MIQERATSKTARLKSRPESSWSWIELGCFIFHFEGRDATSGIAMSHYKDSEKVKNWQIFLPMSGMTGNWKTGRFFCQCSRIKKIPESNWTYACNTNTGPGGPANRTALSLRCCGAAWLAIAAPVLRTCFEICSPGISGKNLTNNICQNLKDSFS